MIVQGNNNLRNVHGLSDTERARAIDFIRNLVDQRLNTSPTAIFRAVDLMGRKVFTTWADTPLDPLYRYYYRKRRDNQYAMRQAGIAAGYLLKRVIENDSRSFAFIRGYKNGYRLLL